MATVMEYAYLADDVYKDDDEGWHEDGMYFATAKINTSLTVLPWMGLLSSQQRHYKQKLKDRGFFARLYANRLTLETVVAYRGTIPWHISDIKTDLKLAQKEQTLRDIDAVNFFDYVRNYLTSQVTTCFSRFPKVVGHSLGGYLAQFVAIERPSTTAIVFNAPGIGGYIDSNIGYINPNNAYYKKVIFNYDLEDDYVHDVGKLVGNVQSLSGNAICKVAEHIAFASISPQLSYQLANNPTSVLHNYFETYYLLDRPVFLIAGYCGGGKEHSIDNVVASIQRQNNIANKVI